MPLYNGIEMVKKIRNIDSKISVIFATAYSDNEFLLDAIKLRVQEYIIKPIDIRKLLSFLNDIASNLYQEFLLKQQQFLPFQKIKSKEYLDFLTIMKHKKIAQKNVRFA